VVSKNERVQKIKACVDARAMEGLGSALVGARAYRVAGADLFFVEAPTTLEELARIPRKMPGRHLCNRVYGGKTPLPSQQALGEMGYGAICYANAAPQASMLAMSNVMKHLKQTGTLEGVKDRVRPFMGRREFVDYPCHLEMEKKCTGSWLSRRRDNRAGRLRLPSATR
jgi:2-methylisocitrate lyase-like PEP mutase family enzyme